MAEIVKITGKSTIDFLGTTYPLYREGQRMFEGMNTPLTRREVVQRLNTTPREIWEPMLRWGMSVINIPICIHAASDTLLEAARHDLTETLEESKLYWGSGGGRGTLANFEYKLDGATATSYKRVYWGQVEDWEARQHGGSPPRLGVLKGHELMGVQLTLYCYPNWVPSAAVTLGPNEIKTPSFEEDGNADGLADNWTIDGTPTTTIETSIVLHGGQSQKVVTDAATQEGIVQFNITAPAGTTKAVAYAWIHRVDPGDDITVILYDLTAGVTRDAQKYDTAGWETAQDSQDNTWKRVVVSSSAIVAGNNHRLYVHRLTADVSQVTTYYVDQTFWKWGTTTCPDEWCDYEQIYNHKDLGVDHKNYFDVDGLKGDVDVPIRMRVEFDVAADETLAMRLRVARRTRGTMGNFVHWLEGEDGTGWNASPTDAKCSGGKYAQTPNSDADHFWNVSTLYGNLADFKGRYRVYGCFRTDAINIKVRLKYHFSGTKPYDYVGEWKVFTVINKWRLIWLGDLLFDHALPSGVAWDNLIIEIESNGSTAITFLDCDYLWLLPDDEGALELGRTAVPFLSVSDEWYYNILDDFAPFAGHLDSAADLQIVFAPKGGLILKPGVENRLYLVCTTYDSPDEIVEVHGASTDLQMKVTLEYLPQYLSPLE